MLENKPNFQSAKIKHEKKIDFGLAIKYVLGEVKTRNISIESVKMRNGKSAKCDITYCGTQLTCVLWESFANQLKLFMDNISTSDTEPVIVELQFAMISNYRVVIKRVSSSHTISDISNGALELNSEEWLNAGSLRTIQEIMNSDAVGTYTCRGTIVDFHPEESCYYQLCGNKRCYKGVPKGSKVGDYCKKCNGPIGSIIIREKSLHLKTLTVQLMIMLRKRSCSNTMSEITPQKYRRDSDLSHVDSDGGDLTFSSTKGFKEVENYVRISKFPYVFNTICGS
ncbi:hypothetical protein OROHE_015934 [Orobanche hederae]